jgi:2-polyprenyl-3-methyl-5-hydroxy-6-metoxy-1,4-benzoquinol methylase
VDHGDLEVSGKAAAIRQRVAAVPYWFHRIDVGHGVVTPGADDSPAKLERLAIPEHLAGKRVLDIGAYDGFFTFECERRGASVLAIDCPQAAGYPVASELVGSTAEFREMSVYDVSRESVGEFDIVLFLGVLYHLRHPLLALERIQEVCRELLILESQICDACFVSREGEPRVLADVAPSVADIPMMQFYPGAELNGDPSNWWAPNLAALDAMLKTSGFEPVLIIEDGVRACVHCIPSAGAQPWASSQKSEHEVDPLAPGKFADSAEALALVDVSAHNAGGSPPTFGGVGSQVVSASQFSHADFERLQQTIFPGAVTIPWGYSEATVTVPHRKVWEFVYVLRAAEQNGRLKPGRRAVGFGVGQEPIPAALARAGMIVLATDLDIADEASAEWAAGAQHMSDLRSLSRPEVVPDDVLEQQVSTRYVDMNAIPEDLGRFDLVWSCCALEHLGSPGAGLEFVLRTLDLLEPGGVSVHTTELELTPRAETADYGNLAVYRKVDLDRLAERVRGLGFEIETNWYVSLETSADRWVSLPPYPHNDPAHLKLVVGDSVSTSVGLLIRRPAD